MDLSKGGWIGKCCKRRNMPFCTSKVVFLPKITTLHNSCLKSMKSIKIYANYFGLFFCIFFLAGGVGGWVSMLR